MSNILVSISCITYNHESYIKDCIKGFLMQKTNFKFEVLIHDDASTDKTADIIREYESKYPELIKPILRTQNIYSQGYRRVNNFNFERAKGKYIALCEGDDYWTDPLKLQKQVDFMENNDDYSMCFHNAIIKYDNNQKSKLFNDLNEARQVSLEDITKKWIIPTASIVFRANILPLFSWSDKVYSGDQTLALLAISKGKVYFLNDIMSVYRVTLKSETSMTKKILGNPEFVLKEHIKLYNLYLNDPFCIDKIIIKNKIKKLNNKLRYRKITSPIYKVYRKLKQLLQ